MRSDEPFFQPITLESQSIPSNLPLLVVLTGFADAGSALSQLHEYINETTSPVLLSSGDLDRIYDYRSRRPMIYFEEHHITEYRTPTLGVYLATDDIGQQFLVLMGAEPDFQWERVVQEVIEIIAALEVSQTVWTHAIPMPVPHTRPMGVTVSGTRRELSDQLSIWKPSTYAPATVGHLLERRLNDAGRDVVGFVLLVPHYLAETEHPVALLTALECISAATGLIFSSDSIRERSRDFTTHVSEQVNASEQSQQLVASLEERHDLYMQDNGVRSPLMLDDGSLPSADQIAGELERFLAIRKPSDNGESVD